MTKLKRWMPLLALAIFMNIGLSSSLPVEKDQKDDQTSNLKSSVPASTHIVMQEKNDSTLADSRKTASAYEPVASPVDLLRPDRFQFYTLNNNGEIITKQMTEKEIQSLIAAGGGHYPMEIHEPTKIDNVSGGKTKVADVVQNVQNVLKGELSKPTTMMVPVPTVPGHATEEWSNILPSILSGDSETSQPVNDASQMEEDPNVMAVKLTNTYDMYKPQPAIIVEMEPHVHESPAQILVGSDYMDHHLRPLKKKPQQMKPDIEEEDPSLDQVPLQTWKTPSKAPEFHYITTEIVPPVKNYTESRTKAPTPRPFTTTMDYRSKNSTSQQTLSMYSEIPMIPVSVITADQILTSTQKSKINEKPVFQILSTISPLAAASTTSEKASEKVDVKPDNVSVVSVTHTTSVKYSGQPEVKISGPTVQATTTTPGKTEPAIEEKKTTSRLVASTLTTERTTESILMTTQLPISESTFTVFNITSQATATQTNRDTTINFETNSPSTIPTETSTETVADTTFMNEITTTKDNTKQTVTQSSNKVTTTEKTVMTDFTDKMSEETTIPGLTNSPTTMYEKITPKIPPSTSKVQDTEELPTDLANSLSSVISQVADIGPSILGEPQNFPLSELKSKNISLGNDLFDSSTPKDLEEDFSTIENLTAEPTSTPLFETTTSEVSFFTTEVTMLNDATTLAKDKSETWYTKKPGDMSQTESTTIFELEDKKDVIDISNILMQNSTLMPTDSNMKVSNKLTEMKHTEAPIIHLDVTGNPTDASALQLTTMNNNNTSESPLIRIQLADIVSAVNHVIDNTETKPEAPLSVHDMTLPPNSYTMSPNIASGLIAGFLSNTMQHEFESYNNNRRTTDRYPTTYDDKQDMTDTTDNMKIETLPVFGSTPMLESRTELFTLPQKTTPIVTTIGETTTVESQMETTTSEIDTFSEITTAAPLTTLSKAVETTVKYITTTETVPTKETSKMKQPENTVNNDAVSETTTTPSLPPGINLTDLPILDYGMSFSDKLNSDKKTTNKNNIKGESSLQNTNVIGTSTIPDNKVIVTTEVPCTSGMKNGTKCADSKDVVKKNDPSNYNINASNKDVKAKNETLMENKTELPVDFIKMPELPHNYSSLQNKTSSYVQMQSKEDSKVTQGYKPLSTTTKMSSKPSSAASEKQEVSYSKVVLPSTAAMKSEAEKEVKMTTPSPSKITPSKQDSYAKLGEQRIKEESDKTIGNVTKPHKANTKRPITASTIKANTNKVSDVTTSPQKPSFRPTKAPTTTVKSSSTLPSNKKTDQVTKDSANNDDLEWSLIPQPTDGLMNIEKQEINDSVILSPVPPANDATEQPHRTGSIPVNLEVVKNSAGLDDTVQHLDEDIQFFSNLCNELAFSFWTSANKGLSNSRSLALSPFGMTSMLAMIFLGARGPTSAQMNDILKLDDVATFNPHLVFQNITDAVSLARNQGIANAAFVRLLFADRIKVGKLMPFYKEQAQKFYEGFVAEVNFSTISDQVKRRTNLLVRKQTGGRIKDFVKTNSIPLRSPLAALSANVFQTNCNSSGASSEGRDGEMYFAVSPAVRQRRLVPVPATVWRSGVLAGYEPGLDATAVALGGSDKLVSTIFVIPGQQGFTAPGDTLDRLEQRLMKNAYREKAWEKLLKIIIPRPTLELQVPKFSHRSVVNATAALKRMGLEELFSRHANLKGINGFGHDIHLADVLQMNLFSTCGDENISNGRHHVEIYPGSPSRNNREMDLNLETDPDSDSEFNASYSGETLNDDHLKSPRLVKNWSRDAEILEKPRLRLDRPFLYFVRHNPTGLILHMGRFNPRLLQ